MQYAIAILIIVVILQFITKGKSKEKPETETISEKISLPIKGAYQKKWLLTYNEKDAYKKLLEICAKNSLYLMTKVRLLDLVEPVKGNPKYKTYFWKIQAKHIDFVVCDNKLVARCMIELDDNSHNEETRKERDSFVDEVLLSVGYKIRHEKAIGEDLEKWIQESCNLLLPINT